MTKKLFLYRFTLFALVVSLILLFVPLVLILPFLGFTVLTCVVFTIIRIALRQFDKTFDRPEETVKEDEHANNPGI